MKHARTTQAAIGAGLVLLACGPSNLATAARPTLERGVDVVLTNYTSCRLQLAGIRLEHGVWSKVPRAQIRPGTTARAKVNAVRRENIAGTVSYRSIGCADLRHDGRRITLHWSRSGDGPATGAFTGTDPTFTTWFFASTETKINAHIAEEKQALSNAGAALAGVPKGAG
jgi:hypothetical protein